MKTAIDLNVDPLDQLQRRRSEKWTGHAPGVISSTVAEMDFPLAGPIVEVLRSAIERDDLGYTPVQTRSWPRRSHVSRGAACTRRSIPAR
ncbi:MAG: hypothetical protein WAN44_05415 [Propionibacteriaceae bacterium]